MKVDRFDYTENYFGDLCLITTHDKFNTPKGPCVVWKKDRGGKFQVVYKQGNVLDELLFEELGINYLIRPLRHPSGGLFMDAYEVRRRLIKESMGKKVLNLFSFTCSLSVAALKGGAELVRNVDTSRSVLNWGKENHELNKLKGGRFVEEEALHFLRRDEKYDLIILDPPAFGRSKRGSFRLEKQGNELLDRAKEKLTDKGSIIFLHHDQNFKVKGKPFFEGGSLRAFHSKP
mgnify:CR=1 FL=1